jgi:hypothetical protein
MPKLEPLSPITRSKSAQSLRLETLTPQFDLEHFNVLKDRVVRETGLAQFDPGFSCYFSSPLCRSLLKVPLSAKAGNAK